MAYWIGIPLSQKKTIESVGGPMQELITLTAAD